VVGGQILIVEVGGAAFTVTRLYGRDWGITIIVGFLSIPLGALVRLLPTAPFERFLIKIKVYRDPALLPTISPDAEDEVIDEKYEYNSALSKVRDNLTTYSTIRGGRINASSMVKKSRSARLKEADIQL
jgi:Ca2+-transporting ATPase